MAVFSAQQATSRTASAGARLFGSVVNTQQSEVATARAAVAGSFMFGGSASASNVATVNYLMSGWSPELNQTVFWQSVNVAELSPTVTAPVCVVANITNKAVVVIY